MGPLIVGVLRALVMWLQYRFDPEMVSFRELKAVRKAKENDLSEIDAAFAAGDSGALSDLLKRLQ